MELISHKLQIWKDEPEVYEKFKKVWTNLAKIDTFCSLRDPGNEEIEDGAKDILWNISCSFSNKKFDKKNGGVEFNHAKAN